MKQRIFLICALWASLASVPVGSFAADAKKSHVQPDAATCAHFEQLMDAIEEGDYQSFVANGDKEFQAALSKAAFDVVAAQVAPREKAGYTATYLTQLSKGGFVVSVWKIHFGDGKDEMLAELSIRDGKVGGFFLR